MKYSLLTQLLAPTGFLVLVPLLYRHFGTSCKSTGHPVSASYRLWLAYLLFVYLFLTPVLAVDEHIPPANLTSIRYFMILIYARAALQYILTYWVKKWTPLIGFTYNVFCLLQFSYLFNSFSEAFSSEASSYHSSTLFLQILVSCLLTDSFYTLVAYRDRQLDNRLTVALTSLFYLALFLLLGSFYV